jgi:hypothetical protein
VTSKKKSETAKATRARSWAHSKDVKKQRASEQKSRESTNKSLRASGSPTPWQAAKSARTARRAAIRNALPKGQS